MPQTTLRPSAPVSAPRVITNIVAVNNNRLVTLVAADPIVARK